MLRSLKVNFDFSEIKADFPILKRVINGKQLVYLDSAATSQKPESVIQSVVNFYKHSNSNVHRGLHKLGEEATAAYEDVRVKSAKFINAPDSSSIIFTKGTTESINFIASAWASRTLAAGDEILLTQMEHHSNLVPWVMLEKEKGIKLKYIPITADGHLDIHEAKKLITNRTKLLSVTLMSNVLGTITPAKELTRMAHAVGAKVLIDGAQAVPHMPVDVKDLDCDFFAFSSHKMLGPTGVGVLYIKRELLESIPPYQGGGEMILKVDFHDVVFNEVPHRFEAGTPNVAGVIGFGAAIDYLTLLGMDVVRNHEKSLTAYALKRLQTVPGLTIYGPLNVEDRGSTISFNLNGIHAHDVGTVLDNCGVAVRAGHHCAMPLMRILNVVATVRASFYVYNNKLDVDRLVDALVEVRRFFHGS